MLGAIVGDVAGSVYERRKYRGGDWQAPLFVPNSRFTDDTVMTIACADALRDIENGENPARAFINRFKEYGERYPNAGYGQKFRIWLSENDPKPYGSWGNGGAMRVSPIGWKAKNLSDALDLARESALVSHNHPEGVKGAQSVAAAIFLARNGASKNDIREYIQKSFGYDLSRTLTRIGEDYRWSSAAATSVPEALIAFLDADDFEGAIRGAIWLGGDADTQAAIAGSVAEAFYGRVPRWMADKALTFLDKQLREKTKDWIHKINRSGGYK